MRGDSAMKLIQKLIDERYARLAARFMTLVCYLGMLLLTMVLALSLMGRQAFSLHTNTNTYGTAIFSEKKFPTSGRFGLGGLMSF